MVLQNHVMLQDGIPARMHFTDHQVVRRTITDRQTGRPTSREVLELSVDSLDGRPVGAVFSTMASKLADQFAPYLPTKSYVQYDFVVTQRGEDFQRSWTVQAIPRV